MYSNVRLAIKYLQFYLGASNGKGHGMHSPFVFDFINTVLNDKNDYPAYKSIEALRTRLLKDNSILSIEEMGAGSSKTQSNQRTVASITRHAAKPPKWGKLLFRIVNKYQPRYILELGTSLGISTSYMAKANPGAKVITLEGAAAIASKARQHFSEFDLENINLITGNFDATLAGTLENMPAVDLAFIDGNHRLEPTINYFRQLLSRSHNDSIMIFDDIHWSSEMEQAWDQIKTNDAVTCTIDLFFIGIVLFRKEFREKQHFSIRF
jgi:predicted O-methyltransferase YrrM